MIGIILAILILVSGFLTKYWKDVSHQIVKRWKLSKLRTFDRFAFPIVGHSYLFPKKAVDFFSFLESTGKEMCQKGYDKLTTLWLGPVPLIVVAHPESVEVLLRSSKHMKKSFVYKFLLPWIGTGLLTSWGRKWQTRRRLITPTFHFNILQDFLHVMNEQSAVMVKVLLKKVENKEEVDVSKSITLCALDIICETAMGKSVKAQKFNDCEYVKAIYRVSDIVQMRQKTPTLWWDFLFNQMKLGKEHQDLLQVLHSFTKDVIQYKMKNKKNLLKPSKNRLAFLDVLLECSNDQGQPLSFSDIQEEVDTFMFEGHDTTAAAMTWAVYLLGRHPEIQQKVHDEIDQVFKGDRNRPVTMEDLRKLVYLEMVIKEALRLYPSVPIIGRVTSEDCVIDGFTVPEGTQVVVFIYTMQRNKNIWSQPDKFDPERFNTENSSKRHPYAFTPFSAGPRNCIGQKFALQEEKVALVHIFHHFKVISYDSPEDLLKSGDIILRPAQKLNIKLIKRF